MKDSKQIVRYAIVAVYAIIFIASALLIWGLISLTLWAVSLAATA